MGQGVHELLSVLLVYALACCAVLCSVASSSLARLPTTNHCGSHCQMYPCIAHGTVVYCANQYTDDSGAAITHSLAWKVEEVYLAHNDFEKLPSTIGNWKCLRELILTKCEQLQVP